MGIERQHSSVGLGAAIAAAAVGAFMSALKLAKQSSAIFSVCGPVKMSGGWVRRR